MASLVIWLHDSQSLNVRVPGKFFMWTGHKYSGTKIQSTRSMWSFQQNVFFQQSVSSERYFLYCSSLQHQGRYGEIKPLHQRDVLFTLKYLFDSVLAQVAAQPPGKRVFGINPRVEKDPFIFCSLYNIDFKPLFPFRFLTIYCFFAGIFSTIIILDIY